jgi:hypothetical protein
MRVAVEIEIAEICNHLVSAAGRDFTHSHEASQGLKHLHVDQVRRMKFVPVAKQACLDAGAKRGLEEELQHRRRIDDNHADSRSFRMTSAAGVFNVTRLRLWSLASISSRVGRVASRSSSASR